MVRRRYFAVLHAAVLGLMAVITILARDPTRWPAAWNPLTHTAAVLAILYGLLGVAFSFTAQLATICPGLFKKMSTQDTSEMHVLATQCIALAAIFCSLSQAN